MNHFYIFLGILDCSLSALRACVCFSTFIKTHQKLLFFHESWTTFLVLSWPFLTAGFPFFMSACLSVCTNVYVYKIFFHCIGTSVINMYPHTPYFLRSQISTRNIHGLMRACTKTAHLWQVAQHHFRNVAALTTGTLGQERHWDVCHDAFLQGLHRALNSEAPFSRLWKSCNFLALRG